MKKITVNASKQYDVLIGKDLLAKTGEICSNYIGICKAAIITDSNVDALYSYTLEKSLIKLHINNTFINDNITHKWCKFQKL